MQRRSVFLFHRFAEERTHYYVLHCKCGDSAKRSDLQQTACVTFPPRGLAMDSNRRSRFPALEQFRIEISWGFANTGTPLEIPTAAAAPRSAKISVMRPSPSTDWRVSMVALHVQWMPDGINRRTKSRIFQQYRVQPDRSIPIFFRINAIVRLLWKSGQVDPRHRAATYEDSIEIGRAAEPDIRCGSRTLQLSGTATSESANMFQEI